MFASAQIQKITVKMSEKIMWSTFTGRLNWRAPLENWDSWINEYMFIYLQTYYEKHWILCIFYPPKYISIFNTFAGVSPIYQNSESAIPQKNNSSLTLYIDSNFLLGY